MVNTLPSSIKDQYTGHRRVGKCKFVQNCFYKYKAAHKTQQNPTNTVCMCKVLRHSLSECYQISLWSSSLQLIAAYLHVLFGMILDKLHVKVVTHFEKGEW